MSIIHIVLFQFGENVGAKDIEAACHRFLALKDKCLHPTSSTPYIKSASGGRDNSPEGKQRDMSHAFVLEFSTAEDRDYYVSKDPKHQEFVKSLSGLVVNAQVMDYTPGIY